MDEGIRSVEYGHALDNMRFIRYAEYRHEKLCTVSAYKACRVSTCASYPLYMRFIRLYTRFTSEQSTPRRYYSIRPSATSLSGLKLLVYQVSSY
jgi:hypothetical protein